jgi:hypothetical protein
MMLESFLASMEHTERTAQPEELVLSDVRFWLWHEFGDAAPSEPDEQFSQHVKTGCT